jgi:predicted porin
MHNYQQKAQRNHVYLGATYRFAPEFQLGTAYLYQHIWKRAPKEDKNNSVWIV